MIAWVKKHPILAAVGALAAYVVWDVWYGLTEHVSTIKGPPFQLPATSMGDRVMYVATFSTQAAAAAFMAYATAAYNGWAYMLTPAEAQANNNDTVFIKPGVAAWVGFDPGGAVTLQAPPGIVAMYRHVDAEPLM